MRGLMILNHNIEDVEALATRALLKRSGLDIVTASQEKTRTIKTAFGLEILADTYLKDVTCELYDFVIIPGGPYVAEKVTKDTEIKTVLKDFNKYKKLIAAICAGPRYLGQAGLLEGKDFTAYTGSEKDVPNGTYLPQKKTVVDGNIITARGAGAVYAFAYEIIAYLQGVDHAEKLYKNILF